MILFFVRNPLDEASWERVEADDLLSAISAHYPVWPATGRIYDLEGIGTPERAISLLSADGLASRDITPHDRASLERLADRAGPLLVTIPPADPVTAIIAVAVTIAAIAAAYLLIPRPQVPNSTAESGNRSLSDRSNRARPTARIPDIFGSVRSVPDLLSVPYRRFDNNLELEISFMCVGRGEYDIDDVRDGDTLLADVAGAAAAFYGPGSSPNRGDDPQLAIGGAIAQEVETIVPCSGVNGQLLRAPNSNTAKGDSSIQLVYPDRVETNDSNLDFTDLFEPGDQISIANAGSYSGTYRALALAAKSITLANPAASNSAWASNFGSTGYISASLSVAGERWIGPFVLDLDDFDHLITNMIAQGGLYRLTSKGKQYPLSITLEVELVPIDQNDKAIGPGQRFQTTMRGSATDKDQVGITLDARPSFTGRCNLRARRVTPRDLDSSDTIVDDVKWRDAYAAAPVGDLDFGNVTTILARTYATSGATSIKERKLNLLARRRVQRRLDDGSLSSELAGSDDLADIATAICLDPFIGGRSIREVDLASFYGASDEIAAYFGSAQAAQFSYTFDSDDISFEETLQIVASACFSHAYRQGRMFRLKFERATEDSTLLFNHRNIMPGSQKRTTRFGTLNDQDGVELEYQVPKDGAKLTISLPADRVPTSPRKIDLPGIGNAAQARWQAERAWARLRFQNVATEFEATQEAAMLLPQDRVLVVDVTRPDYLSGDIEGQQGAELLLSHAIALDPTLEHQIFLQLPDGTLQSLGVEALPGDGRSVRCSAVPRLPLVVDFDQSARSTFTIAPLANVDSRAFLISEREPAENFVESVKASIYSFLIYQYDQLALWLAMTGAQVRDDSALSRSIENEGPARLAMDFTRQKKVLAGVGGPGIAIEGTDTDVAYTKAAWISGAAEMILGTPAERFAIIGGDLVMDHAGQRISAATTAGWHHVAAAYDGPTGLARLYIDGREVGRRALPPRGAGELRALDQLQGSADDVRLYRRALSGREIEELYRSTARLS